MKKLLGIVVLGLLICNIGFTESNYNLNDPALNKCFKKMLGEERYQEVIFSGSQTPNNQENKSITGCQEDPDYWRAGSLALGYNTPDNYYDIFDGNKMENCISNPNPVFTHEITDFSKIKHLKRWGLTPQGYLKGHTYIFLKNNYLLVLSAWFSGMEIAMFSLSSAKIKKLILDNDKKNKKLSSFVISNISRLLVTGLTFILLLVISLFFHDLNEYQSLLNKESILLTFVFGVFVIYIPAILGMVASAFEY